MTPKQRVQKRYPEAYLHKAVDGETWNVYPKDALTVFDCIGYGTTPKAAWAEAAKGLK